MTVLPANRRACVLSAYLSCLSVGSALYVDAMWQCCRSDVCQVASRHVVPAAFCGSCGVVRAYASQQHAAFDESANGSYAVVEESQ